MAPYSDAFDYTNCLSMSIRKDLLIAISKGKLLTFKLTSIDLGSHSLTKKKLPILLLYREGHCASLDMANDE